MVRGCNGEKLAVRTNYLTANVHTRRLAAVPTQLTWVRAFQEIFQMTNVARIYVCACRTRGPACHPFANVRTFVRSGAHSTIPLRHPRAPHEREEKFVTKRPARPATTRRSPSRNTDSGAEERRARQPGTWGRIALDFGKVAAALDVACADLRIAPPDMTSRLSRSCRQHPPAITAAFSLAVDECGTPF